MRVCTICGKPITSGMTNETGDFYIHEGKCFNKYMNNVYGKHRWMELGNGDQDEFGGYYVVTTEVVGGIQGTGIFYTEWEDDDESKVDDNRNYYPCDTSDCDGIHHCPYADSYTGYESEMCRVCCGLGVDE